MNDIDNTSAPASHRHVPYADIVKQLLEIGRQTRENMEASGADTTYFSRHWYREFCTVHVGGARQTGMTRSIAELIIPRTIVVVKDAPMREYIYSNTIGRLQELGSPLVLPCNMASNAMAFPMATVRQIQDALKARPRLTLQVTLEDDDPDPQGTVNKIVDEFRAKQALTQKDPDAGFDRFIVDEASFVFDRIPIKDFYKWAELHAHGKSPEFVFLG